MLTYLLDVEIIKFYLHITILRWKNLYDILRLQRQEPPSAGTDDGCEQNQRFARRTCMHGYDIILTWLCQFPLGKGYKIWLFLMQPSSQPGSARADDANAEEATVDMVPGDAVRFLSGIPEAWTMLPVVGKRTTRCLYIRVDLTLCPTARFSAFPAIRILLLTVDVNQAGAGLSRSKPNQEVRVCLIH